MYRGHAFIFFAKESRATEGTLYSEKDSIETDKEEKKLMDKKLPDITILMSTYNRRKYLPLVLKDLQGQTLSNWRLIVVNDGGEEVEDIVLSLLDARMEYYTRCHAGKAAQLNYAMQLVESKYIGYLDDDDRVMPNHYELLYNAAESTGAEFVYSNVQPVVLNSKDDTVIEEWPVNDEDTEWNDIRLYNKINHSTILHTKSLAEKVGAYDERMQVLIDFDYIKRLAFLEKPLHVHATTYRWNLRQNEEGKVESISGLWEKEPDVTGRSLLAFFEKDPASLSRCYRENLEMPVIRQRLRSLELEQDGKMQLLQHQQQQMLELQNRLTSERAANSAKSQKHLLFIRMLMWLNIVLIILLIVSKCF